MVEIHRTQFVHNEVDNHNQVSTVLTRVYAALKQKGYNPINQIVGYIMSGDPTYLTSHNGARKLISKIERDELVEEMLKAYIYHHSWE